jgi:hypothetical protein
MALEDRKVEGGSLIPIAIGKIADGLTGSLPVTTLNGVTVSVSESAFEIPQGNVTGQSSVNKFGRSTNVDTGVNTDIWDRANAANDQDIWLAPTAARIHTIASTSANDTTGGTGANSVVISYLPDWNTVEQTETVTGNLNAGIAMVNAAVIIHRMRVVPQVTSTSANVGTITATAAGDATVTAQIQPGEGQTQMAIYGIPSIQTAYMTNFYASVLRSNAATAFVDLRLLFNPSPNINTVVWLVKHSLGIQTTGANPHVHPYNPYNKFTGPGILKLQAAGSTDNLDVSGGFDLILVDN